jgi:hypothetical protein
MDIPSKEILKCLKSAPVFGRVNTIVVGWSEVGQQSCVLRLVGRRQTVAIALQTLNQQRAESHNRKTEPLRLGWRVSQDVNRLEESFSVPLIHKQTEGLPWDVQRACDVINELWKCKLPETQEQLAENLRSLVS